MPGRILRAATALATLLPLLALTSSDLPPQNLPVLGGTGGIGFTRDCGAGYVLTGLRYRSGLVIDALGLLCRPVLAGGALGPETSVGGSAGGGGGTAGVASCPSGSVVNGSGLVYGSYVSHLVVYCQAWIASTRSLSTASAGFKGAVFIGTPFTPGTATHQTCESPLQPGSGIRGRAASVIDAVGLVCDEP